MHACLLLGTTTFANAPVSAILSETPVKQIQKHYAKGEWEAGKKLAEKELAENTLDADLRMLIGKYHYHFKQYDQARYQLVKAIQIHPSHVEAKQMLVDVEMETKRYSSAICYVNELLEINPYWKGLWKKKMKLYDLQGNKEESQRLRVRLHQIYPEDTSLKEEFQYATELNAEEAFKHGNIDKAIELRQLLVQTQPQSEVYYLGLINELLKGGDKTTALNYTNRALLRFPNNQTFVDKKAGILAEEQRYSELLPFLATLPNKSAYNYYVLEAAQNARKNQAEVLYAAVLAQQPANEEAYAVVFSEAMAKQQYEEALQHLERYRKAKGPSKALSMQEYKLHMMLGNSGRAMAILEQMFASYGSDQEIKELYVQRYMERAKNSMQEEQYREAIYAWEQVRLYGDEQAYRTAQRGLYTANDKIGRTDLAGLALENLLLNNPQDREVLFKKADLQFKQQQYKQAVQTYQTVLAQVTAEERPFYLIGYEELLTKIVQTLREKSHLVDALAFTELWLEEDPQNYNALLYATNLAIQLHNPSLQYKYAAQGAHFYAQEAFFQSKLLTYHVAQKETDLGELFEDALADLKQHPYHEGLRNAFVEVSEKHAIQLLKAQQTTEALSIVNTALDYVPEDITLKYTKGRVFEKQKQLDSAYYYQSFYVPSPMEMQAHKQHLNYLKYAGGQHHIGISYLRARHGDVDESSDVSSVEYTYLARRNSYTGRVNYVGRPSGKGVQLQGEWGHTWNAKTSTQLDAAWSNDHFPTFVLNGRIGRFFETLGNTELTLGLGYRRLVPEAPQAKKENMFNLTVGANKTWDKFSVHGKFNNFLLDKKWLYNAAVDGRYYLSSPKSYIIALASVGSSPDVELIDYQLYNGFSVLNTMVGAGISHLVTNAVQVGVIGSWYNYKSSKDTYRDLYTLYFHVNVAF